MRGGAAARGSVLPGWGPGQGASSTQPRGAPGPPPVLARLAFDLDSVADEDSAAPAPARGQRGGAPWRLAAVHTHVRVWM